jgi:hypothetical protein
MSVSGRTDRTDTTVRDPTPLMVEHEGHGEVGYDGRLACVPNDAPPHCTVYQLAERLRTVAELVSAGANQHDRHAKALNGLIADCAGCLAQQVREALP